jgi:eukaryotic-like serine/threonine-protein kinase
MAVLTKSVPVSRTGDPLDADASPELLIGGGFAVDVTQPLAGAGGGQSAFLAVDRRAASRTGLMALHVRPDAPARSNALISLSSQTIEGVLTPLAHGAAKGPGGRMASFVICQAPPGTALANATTRVARPWGEAELLDLVLRPAAAALHALHERHVTHRAIRLENMFRAGPRDAVTLGAAWAAPPARLQPAIYEPPYAAMCLPSGRGEGSGADDVYALGVALLALALGRVPLEGLDDTAIIRRKLELGSFAALAGEERLPPLIVDLVRGMLAEDPEHRPLPALLADPAAARARRVAARPPRRGQRALEVGLATAWTARTLAYSIAADPGQGVRLLRNGSVDRWIRRSLGDSSLASRLEDAVRLRGGDAGTEDQRADAMLAMRAVAVLDPLAPLCWRGVALWPDGLGPALAAADPAAPEHARVLDMLQQMVASEAMTGWAASRSERCDAGMLRQDAHQQRMLLRMRGWGGGLARLRYVLNPLLACRSPLLEGQVVTRLADLLPALEAVAGRTELRQHAPIDREIAGFLAARHDSSVESDLAALAEVQKPEIVALVQLRLLAGLQERLPGRRLPALAAWLTGHVTPALSVWRNRRRRVQLEQALAELSSAGELPAMLALLEDPSARAADQRELEDAIAAVRDIDAKLARLDEDGKARGATARLMCQELAAGIGAVVLTAAVIAAVMS